MRISILAILALIPSSGLLELVAETSVGCFCGSIPTILSVSTAVRFIDLVERYKRLRASFLTQSVKTWRLLVVRSVTQNSSCDDRRNVLLLRTVTEPSA